MSERTNLDKRPTNVSRPIEREAWSRATENKLSSLPFRLFLLWAAILLVGLRL